MLRTLLLRILGLLTTNHSKSISDVTIYFADLGLGGVQRKIVDIVNFMATRKLGSSKILLKSIEASNFSFFHLLTEKNKKNVTALGYGSILWKLHHLSPYLYAKASRLLFVLKLILYFFNHRAQTHLIFLYYDLPEIVFALRFVGAKRIILSMDMPISKDNDFAFTKTPRSKKRLAQTLEYVDLVLFQTPEVQADFFEYFGKEYPSKIIPNWALFSVPKWKKTHRSYDFLYIGRTARQKRVFDLVNLLAKLKTNQKFKAHMFTHGDNESIAELITQVFELGLTEHIDLKLPTLDTKMAYENSKYLILTSEYESYPMVIPEALSHGCIPIVISNHKLNLNQNDFFIHFNTIKPDQIQKLLVPGVYEKLLKKVQAKFDPKEQESRLKQLTDVLLDF